MENLNLNIHPILKRNQALPPRIYEKFKIGNSDECWLWTASKTRHGYGRVRWNGHLMSAHRIVYSLFFGDPGPNLVLDHKCRNTSCVRPTHLEPVKFKENVMRGVSFAVTNSKKTHCDSGHEFTPENTYPNGKYGRGCKSCRSVAQKKWLESNPEKRKEVALKHYYKVKNTEEYKEKQRQYCSDNAFRRKDYLREWRAKQRLNKKEN